MLARLEADTGLAIKVIDGEEEARYAFLGAVHGLPIDTGYLIDVGGGSFELAYFERRRALRWWTFELGALVATDQFLGSDPPRASEMAELRDHVIQTLHDAGVPPLPEDGGMVGTGGTVRNLAKIHMRSVAHPIARVDGYVLQRREVRELTSRLTTRNRSSSERYRASPPTGPTSIAGGALVVIAAMDALGAKSLMVSGHGLREGIALAELELPLPEVLAGPARLRDRARVAVLHLGRAAGPHAASSMTRAILGVADPAMTAEMREVLDHATTLLDVGQSINYYDRWTHAAGVTASADLQGFTHREVALIATTLARLGKARSNLPATRGCAPATTSSASTSSRSSSSSRTSSTAGSTAAARHPSVSTSAATGWSSRPAFPTRGSRRTWPGGFGPAWAGRSACVQQRRPGTERRARTLQTVDRLVEVLDERDQDGRRIAGEHERLDGRDLPAQSLDRVAMRSQGAEATWLHSFEYAMGPGPQSDCEIAMVRG